jgi:hypothetical protein
MDALNVRAVEITGRNVEDGSVPPNLLEQLRADEQNSSIAFLSNVRMTPANAIMQSLRKTSLLSFHTKKI